MTLCHVPSYFGGTKTLQMGEKWWNINRDLDAPPASVRTSTNVDRMGTFIRQDRRLTIRMIADDLNINECTVH
jgi:hypothetical protein